MQSTTDGWKHWALVLWILYQHVKLQVKTISNQPIQHLQTCAPSCYPQRNDNYVIHTNNCLPNRIMTHWCKSPHIQNQSACRCVEHGFSQHHGKPKPFSQKNAWANNRACLFALELFQPINESTRRRKAIQTNQRNSDFKTYMQVIQLNSCTFSTFSLVCKMLLQTAVHRGKCPKTVSDDPLAWSSWLRRPLPCYSSGYNLGHSSVFQRFGQQTTWDASKKWLPTRSICNQHCFYISNINISSLIHTNTM